MSTQHSYPPQSIERRFASLRAELLPPLSPGRASCRAGRYLDQPRRIQVRSAKTGRPAVIDGGATEPVAVPPRAPALSAGDAVQDLRKRIGQSVLGQDHLVESMLIGLLANGNLLIESLPGLAKTRAVKTLAKNLAADLSRVQFTPDLLPS